MSMVITQIPFECPVCFVIIKRKCDLTRHLKSHDANKQKTIHKCPWPGCKFENQQRSNVSTHYRTHSQNKTKLCPDCEFRTCDPGSLTRHRKRIHGYIPRPRKSGVPKPRDAVETDVGTSTGLFVTSQVGSSGAPQQAPTQTSGSTPPSSALCSSSPSSVTALSLPADWEDLIALPEPPSLPQALDDTRTPVYWERFFNDHVWPKPLYPAVETNSALQNLSQAPGQSQALAMAHQAPCSTINPSLLLAGSHPASAPDVMYPEAFVGAGGVEMVAQGAQGRIVQVGESYSSIGSIPTSTLATSGWEVEGVHSFSSSTDRITAPSGAEYHSAWSLAQPQIKSEFDFTNDFNAFAGVPNSAPLHSADTPCLSLDSSSMVLPGPGADYQYYCDFNGNLSLGFDQSLVGMGSPVRTSPCSSPESSSPMSVCPSLQSFNNGQMLSGSFEGGYRI